MKDNLSIIMSLNISAPPLISSTPSNDHIIDMPADVMMDYTFPYIMQTDFIANEPIHPLLNLPRSAISKKTSSYTPCVLTRQDNGLWVPIYYNEVRPWSSILSEL
jgi:hypothetical protein